MYYKSPHSEEPTQRCKAGIASHNGPYRIEFTKRMGERGTRQNKTNFIKGRSLTDPMHNYRTDFFLYRKSRIKASRNHFKRKIRPQASSNFFNCYFGTTNKRIEGGRKNQDTFSHILTWF
jgi:hypothetical protein